MRGDKPFVFTNVRAGDASRTSELHRAGRRALRLGLSDGREIIPACHPGISRPRNSGTQSSTLWPLGPGSPLRSGRMTR